MVALRAGDLVEAERRAGVILADARGRGDVVEICRAAQFLANLLRLTHRPGAAVEHADLALAQPVIGGLRNTALVARARVTGDLGDWDRLRALLQELWANVADEDPARNELDVPNRATGLRLQAHLRLRDGDLAGARIDIDHAVRLFPAGVDVVVSRAVVLALQGEVDESEATLHRWMGEAERVWPERLAVLSALARLRIVRDDLDGAAAAIAAYEAEIAADGRDPRSDNILLVTQASFRTESGDRGPGTAALVETVLARHDAHPIMRAAAQLLRAEIRLAAGDVHGAGADVRAAMPSVERAGDPVGLGDALTLRARTAAVQGRVPAARADLDRAVATLGQAHVPVVARHIAEVRAMLDGAMDG
jgi:hypothetical protein